MPPLPDPLPASFCLPATTLLTCLLYSGFLLFPFYTEAAGSETLVSDLAAPCLSFPIFRIMTVHSSWDWYEVTHTVKSLV